MASTVPAARTAIYEGLTALTGAGSPLEGVAVFRSGQLSTVPEFHTITVLNMEPDSYARTRLLDPRRMESYTIPISIVAVTATRDPQDAEDLVFLFFDAVELWLMTNPTLGVPGMQGGAAGDIAGNDSGPVGTDNDSSFASLTYRFDCRALVNPLAP